MKEERIKLDRESRLYVTEQLKSIICPQLFIVLQWSPFALDYQTAVSHSRHFKNVLLCQLYDCRLKDIPEDRCRMALFHEKAEADISHQRSKSPRYRYAYHSNIHIGGLPELCQEHWNLDLLISQKVSPKCKSLSKAKSKNNKGFIVREWKAEYHQFYNFKDLSIYQHDQDGDLVIDYENSDFRSLETAATASK